MKRTPKTLTEVTPSTPPARKADPPAVLKPAIATPTKSRASKLAVAQRLINLDKQYHGMSADEVCHEFARLNKMASREGKNVKNSLERAIPHLSALQMLTSQRGVYRKAILAAAKLPTWSKYLNAYADRYSVSAVTIKRRIRAYRGKAPAQPKESAQKEQNAEPRLTVEQTRKAIKGLTVAGEAFDAYKAHQPIDPFVAQWDRVKFAPEEQTRILDMLEGNVDPDAELKEKLTSIVKTAESYVAFMETIVYSRFLTEEQKESLRRRAEPWRKVLRWVRGAEQARAA